MDISPWLTVLKLENMGILFLITLSYTTHLLAPEESDDGDEVAGDAYQHEEDATGGGEAKQRSRVALEQLEVKVV